MIGLEVSLTAREPGNQPINRQRFENHPGRERQHLVSTHFHQLPDGVAGRLRRLHTRLTGTGIGNPGVNDQRANVAATGQMFSAQVHRRSAEAILRKHPRHGTARIKRQ